MRNAFVIACIKPNDFYIRQTVACIMSIRQKGHTEDIVVLTREPELLGRVKGLAIIKTFDPIHFPAVEQTNHPICRLDPYKMNYWRLCEYDKVIALDADNIMIANTRKVFSWPEFTCVSTYNAPVEASMMLLKPDMDTFEDMVRMARCTDFNTRTGWNNVGLFPHWLDGGKMSDWTFHSACSMQGFLFYYFKYVKGTLRYGDLRFFFYHYGDVKYKPEYREAIGKLIKMM